MKQYWVKLTNCTTETGGGKIPKRLRHNQNIHLVLNEFVINKIPKYLYNIERYGTFYNTTFNSKCIILKEV